MRCLNWTTFLFCSSDPNDIDIFTGLMSEEVIDNKLGPTAGCILGEQFRRLKYGDRFWYENQDTDTATHQFTDGKYINSPVYRW